jgi:hypothetical protein
MPNRWDAILRPVVGGASLSILVLAGACDFSVPPRPTPVEWFTITARTGVGYRDSVADVRVEVVNGPDAGTFCQTDARGTCTLPARFHVTTLTGVELRATKEEWAPKVVRLSTLAATGGVITVQFSMRPASIPDFSGTYTVAIRAGTGCTDFPDDARDVTGTATVVQDGTLIQAIPDLPVPSACNAWSGSIDDDVLGLAWDPDCIFPFSGPPGVIAAPLNSNRALITANSLSGLWRTTPWVLTLDGDLTVQEGSLQTGFRIAASCRATDHTLTFTRR